MRTLTEINRRLDSLEAEKTQSNVEQPDTPVFVRRVAGPRTTRRFSSAFDPIRTAAEQREEEVQEVQMTIAEVKIDQKDQMQRLSYSAILWLMDKYEQ